MALVALVPLEPAFAQTATASGTTADTSGPASPTIDHSNTPATPPSTTDASTAPSVSGSGQSTNTSPTASGPSNPANAPMSPQTSSETGGENTQSGAASPTTNSGETSNTNTQNQNANLSPLAPGAQTGPDLQPVVYNSFNQNQTKIDKNTGALQTTYPIDVPPGRNGLQPDLDLVYNSENTAQGSIFGEGWSISIPYVERLNLVGVENLYSTSTANYFTSSLDGELSTTTVAGSYIARTDHGTFDKYTFSTSTDSWTMIDKNGNAYTFGSTADSQQSNPNNASDTFKWMLKQETDPNGNYILYNYFKDSNQIYPSSTVYDNTTSTTGIFEVDFQRATNADNATSSATGFPVQSNYRVSEIDVKVNGTWVRKYSLGYTTGDNGTTALLRSIAESGENASGTVVSMPSSTFTYQTDTAGWTSTTLWNPPTPFVANGGVDDGVRIGDVNGDDLSDIVASTSWVNNRNGWTQSSTWNAPVSFANSGADNGWRVVDLTNNGLDDLVSCTGAYMNTGSGWATSSTWTSPVCFTNNGTSTGAILADVNGDGLPDILQGYTDASGTAHYAAWTNTGSGWATSTLWTPPVPFVTYGGVDNGVRLADVNGDGLPDILQGYTDASSTAHYASWINTGDGWATSTVWDPPILFMSNGGWDNGARFADLDGNGLTDIIQGYSDVSGNPHYAAYLDTGNGWATSTAWEPPTLFDTDGGYDAGARTADVLGTGLPDILSGYTDYQGDAHYASWLNDNSVRADILTNITYPQGGSSAITYKAAAPLTSGGGLTNTAPYPVFVVTQIATNDGAGNISPVSYQYASGTYYYGGSFDHEFAGFGEISQTDGAGNTTKTYYDTGNGVSSSTGQYQDNFWKIGEAYRVDQYSSTGSLYETTITKWDDVSLGGNAAFVFPDQTLTMEYDGGASHDDAADSFTYSTSTGNETQEIQWGQVTGNNSGSFATSSFGYTTNYTYASSVGSNVTGKISDETLTNPSSTKIQETEYYYDNLGLGSIGAGNLTKESDWVSGSTYANTAHSYNSYGLVTQTLDPLNSTTTYSYDSYNLYPATTTNALGQSTGYQYDYSTGKTSQMTDPNGDVFQTVYDGVGRTLDIIEPSPAASSTFVTSTAYVYTDTSGAVSAEETDYLNASTSVTTYTYYDGLGRAVQTRKSSASGGVYKVSDETYNNIGLTASRSLPYFGNGSSETAATTTPALFTNYTYDPLQRALTTTNAVGSTTNAYGPWMTTSTDPNGDVKGYFYDAFGNLAEVQEHNGTSTYTTSYSYDGLKDLANITDANGNVRAFSYDGLGDRLSAADLHASTSSSYGTWSYSYDLAGNLATSTDPDGHTVSYVYDALNRETSEAVSGQSGNAATYTYDSCTNGIGHLCEAVNGSSTVEDTYDPLGDVASETKIVNGNSYDTSYTYDWQKNKLTITNPDNSVVAYTYNPAGFIATVSEEEPSSTWNTIVSSITYSPMDQVVTEAYGDGATTNNIYDPTRLYRLNSTVTTVSSGGQQMVKKGGSIKIGGIHPLVTDSCTGQETTYTVPAGTYQLQIIAYGAQGQDGGGLGGEVQGTLSVTPSSTYYVNVGCQDGYNGGGSGAGGSFSNNDGGNGGGMTWFSANSFFTTSTVLLVAGGGGGTGGTASNPAGGPGAGGAGGGSTGGIGGTGSAGYCGQGYCAGGGGGGSQTSGGGAGSPAGLDAYVGTAGNAGQGGNGGAVSTFVGAGAGAGGGGGYFGGGGGAGNGYAGGDEGSGGGGGGGSSYLASSPSLTNTSTAAGVNTGDGSIIITPIGNLNLASSSQYVLNTTTTLADGTTTTQNGVSFGAILNNTASTTVQLQVEVEPAGVAFTGTPDVTSSPLVAPGNLATTSFVWANGSYHWQARVADANDSTSSWRLFGPSSTSTDFTIQYVPSPITENYTGATTTWTVPTDIASITISAKGASGGNGPAGGGGASGGAGGAATGTLSVIPGAIYYIAVGQQAGPFGGGAPAVGSGNTSGAAGGGMTWFGTQSSFSTSSVILVAGGGGGGASGQTGAGAGGNGGGTTGSAGGSGNYGTNGTGGGGGTQSGGGAGGAQGSGCGSGSNGSAGQGGSGRLSLCGWWSSGGGGGGYYGGGGGGAGSGSSASAGGGGGSSYVSSVLTGTSTTAGANSGNGYLIITPILQPTPLAPLGQYYVNGVSSLGEGSTTSQGTVVFKATLNATSSATTTLELQVEVEPAGNAFTNSPNVSSSAFVSPGSVATTSFSGINGSYHWQARWKSALGSTSPWQMFGLMPAATDFTFVTAINEPYTGSAGSFVVPPHISGLSINAQGAAGLGGGSTSASQGGGGGAGARASGTLAVSSGQTYYFYVGGQSGVGGGTGGGGGSGNNKGANGGNGGDSSWFGTASTFSTSTTILVAGGGGGGGGGGWTTNDAGGGGGYSGGSTGGNGGKDQQGVVNGGTGGSFGTNATGGSGGGGCGTGGTGGSGLYGSGAGGGGSGGNCNGGSNGGGGGGGGASFLSSLLTSTGTAGNVNTSTGSLSLTEIENLVPFLSSTSQYYANGVTPLGEGSSTSQNTVVFGANLGSYFARSLQLQVEVEPAGVSFSNTPNATSSFVANSGFATTSFTGVNGGYHWQYRAIDAQNNTSSWQLFGPSSTSTDFTLAAPTISFTTPQNGTTTPNFPNWELYATNVTSTTSYTLNVVWDNTTGGPEQSSTITASGTAIMAGVSVSKPTSSLDYTYDGTPVLIVATGTLSSASTTVASTSISYTEETTVTPLNCGSTAVQCVSYKYDNDGNIIQITDDSATDAAKTVYYSYDNFNRLTSASSTGVATGTDYAYTYTYDPVGNILSGPAGTYSYGGTGYPNPDAVTSITQGSSTINFSYDNNGNLASSSDGFAYTWDYHNRLMSATASGTTSTYGYDYTGERVISQVGTSSPIYDPEVTYSAQSGVATKNVIAGNALTATISGSGASSTTYTVLTSNLGSTNVILSASGTISELLDYLPYGALRLDEQLGTNNRRKYVGQIYDPATQFMYLNARYYEGPRGQFLSEDPVFLAMGSRRLNQLINGHLSSILANPQALNAYSYATDNPITNSDPSGKATQSIEAQLSSLLSELSSLLQELSTIASSPSYGGSGGYAAGGGNAGSSPMIATQGTKSNSAINGSEDTGSIPSVNLSQSAGQGFNVAPPTYPIYYSLTADNLAITSQKGGFLTAVQERKKEAAGYIEGTAGIVGSWSMLEQGQAPSTANAVANALEAIPQTAEFAAATREAIILSIDTSFFATDLISAGLYNLSASLKN